MARSASRQQLGPHDRGAADLHPQHALAEHHVHVRRAGLLEDGLAPHPQRHLQIDVLAAAGARRAPQYRAGIVLGLQQAGHHHGWNSCSLATSDSSPT